MSYDVDGRVSDHALSYAQLGWEIFPASPETKAPLVSQYDATSDPERIRAWWRRWPDALIGCRVPEDQIVLDIDPRHGGRETWKALTVLMGEVDTRIHYSGRGDKGGHVWFKRPAGTKLTITKLDAWAKEHGVGRDMGSGRHTGGIDLLQRDHRYTILPPSLHPETHKPYYWSRGPETQPIELPGLLGQLLTYEQPPKGETWLKVEEDSIADWYSQTHGFSSLLAPKGWVCVGGDGESDGSHWRHPEATSSVSASIRDGCLFVYSTSTVFEPTEPGRPRGYTPFRVYAVLEHGGDLKAAGRAAREAKGPAWRLQTFPSSNGQKPDMGSGTRSTALVPLIEDERFWTLRPDLMVIRDFARARMCSPWALLGVVLAQVAAATPPWVTLPPLIGSHLSLNTFVILIGGSGSGKDAALSAGRDVLDVSAANPYKVIGLGSGEGLLDQYVRYDTPKKDEPESGGLVQHNEAVLFTNPEIETVKAVRGRPNATLMPELRSAWTGAQLGSAYASVERRLSVMAHKYRLCLVLGAQPEHTDMLLDDEAAGTPQRFVWFPTEDPLANPHLVEPDPLKLKLPVIPAYSSGPRAVDICQEAKDEIVEARLARLRGETGFGLDGHALACREKVAVLLAILDGRAAMTLADWSLAGTIMNISNAVRARAQSAVKEVGVRVNHAKGVAEGERLAVVDDVIVERAAQAIRRKLAQGECRLGKLKSALTYGRTRDNFEPAIEAMLATGEVVEERRESGGNKGVYYRLR